MNIHLKLLCLFSVAVLSQGCIVIVTDNGGDDYDDDHHSERESAEDICLDAFDSSSYTRVYDAETDCGGGAVGAVEVRDVHYRETDNDEGYSVRGKVNIFEGEEFLKGGLFYSTCGGDASLLRMDVRLGAGENNSEHAVYRCEYNMDGLGKTQPCYLTLADGKRIDTQPSCTMSLFQPVRGERPDRR